MTGDRPWWPWLVAALFVVAAAIAGVIVWHQLSGGGPQEPVGSYDNCELAERRANQITAAHLVAAVRHGPTTKCQTGHVFQQDPTEGTPSPKGGTVTIWVSTGKPKVAIPKLAGQTWADAQQGADRPRPETGAGTIVPGGKTKGIVTGDGPGVRPERPQGLNRHGERRCRTGDQAGPERHQREPAAGAVRPRGRTASTSSSPATSDSNQPQNYVVSQDPQPGSSLAQGSSVNVTLSNGPPHEDGAAGRRRDASQADARPPGCGFHRSIERYVTVTDPTQDDIVQSQSPDGNSQAPEHSTVTINVGQYSGPPTTTPTTTTTTGQ